MARSELSEGGGLLAPAWASGPGERQHLSSQEKDLRRGRRGGLGVRDPGEGGGCSRPGSRELGGGISVALVGGPGRGLFSVLLPLAFLSCKSEEKVLGRIPGCCRGFLREGDSGPPTSPPPQRKSFQPPNSPLPCQASPTGPGGAGLSYLPPGGSPGEAAAAAARGTWPSPPFLWSPQTRKVPGPEGAPGSEWGQQWGRGGGRCAKESGAESANEKKARVLTCLLPGRSVPEGLPSRR